MELKNLSIPLQGIFFGIEKKKLKLDLELEFSFPI